MFDKDKYKYAVKLLAGNSVTMIVQYTIFELFAYSGSVYLLQREDAAQLHQFILHAALDIVQDLAWTTSAM